MTDDLQTRVLAQLAAPGASIPFDAQATPGAPHTHPGALLREDFLPAYGLSPGGLARAMGLAPTQRQRIERMVRERQPVTPDTALRLERVFQVPAAMWMAMQAAHDLSVAQIAARASGGLEAIHPLPVPLPDAA